MPEDDQLLLDYQRAGSERAFEELVRRYVNLVYSTALRRAGSQPQLIEDIVQKVFIDFASEAPRIRHEVKIGGWLHRHTCFVAASALRTERRRRLREERSLQMNPHDNSGDSLWAKIEPILDRAIDSLAEKDRLAIVLRFFEKRDLRAIGAALGTNEDAAQKRVTRALEKLRRLLGRRGTTVPLAALSSALLANSAVAAPAAMTSAISAAAFASVTVAGLTVGTVATPAIYAFYSMGKAKIAYISAAVVAGVGTTVLVHQTWIDPLEVENDALRAQVARLEVRAESSPPPSSTNDQKLEGDQFLELMRLRGQVTQLRQATNEAQRLAEENQRLRASAAANQSEPKPEPIFGQFMPKESWQFVGFAQPDAAFQSAVWAMTKGDLDTLSASAWTDEYLESRLRRDWEGKSEDQIKASMAREFEKVRGFSVNKVEPVTESETIVEIGLQAEGEPPIHRARMKKIGNDWRFDGFARKSN